MLQYSPISFALNRLAMIYKNNVLATQRSRATTIKKIGENKLNGSADNFIEIAKKATQRIIIISELKALNTELK